MDWQEFETFAQKTMGEYFGVLLIKKEITGFPKRFDMVSPDGQFVGDAKYLTLVRGIKRPPAKFMEIASHVWLLEKVTAKKRFLVFGNQREVPEWWLKEYGTLVKAVEFYFLHLQENGRVERLN